jgi:hypothetical protein
MIAEGPMVASRMTRSGYLAVWVLLGSTACGDDGGSGAHDAAVTDVASPDAAADAAACTMGNADHPTFWPTICDAADTCGWLTGGHAELENDEASCNTRHAGDPEPSTQLTYLAGFETRIHAAAACLGCQALVDAYFRPDLETVFCGHLDRCGLITESVCRTRYQADAMRPGAQAKFDHACPRYCIEQLAIDAPCPMVMACASACS